jgi:Zn-dependent peptidase ImmA (M78 family)
MTETPLQNLNQLEAALEGRGLDAERHRPLMESVRRYLRRYARLETRLLGHVWISLPTHLLDLHLPEDPVDAGEELARRERERLGLAGRETGDVMELLEHEGLKVYRPRFPEGSPLDGFFLFDQEVGPALVVNGGLPPLEADFVFARLYAHFLVDNNPYRIRFAEHGGAGSASREELRAQAFAAAFLVSPEAMGAYLKALGWRPGTAIDRTVAVQLAVYFEVGFRTLMARLLTLRLVRADEVEPLLESLAGSDVGPASERRITPIGERFIRLALEAHARKVIDDKTLAEYLESEVASARELAARFSLEPPSPENEAPGPAKPAGAKRRRRKNGNGGASRS